MRFVFFFLALALLSFVEAVVDKRKPWRLGLPLDFLITSREAVRNRNRLQLRKALAVVLDQSKELVSRAENQALKHMAVKKAREEMFDIYDTSVAKHCSDEADMENKKKVVKDAWEVLALFLFRLDNTDMHNGCFTADIAFPSLIYD
ncbi:hypothetical protein PSACC_01816 [Paramicrosporidium saccamoebae]|uniref:Uncharacterized protein n=1 Tax=Paramicrosporidium saccamoebae TaxID=1246581 RepID=A0A2H9TKX5_9FUNG|nr:hypothetical protein PSACC_01816 [Paramicrosporidium saccamoebae]